MNNIFSDSLDMSSQRSLLRALGWTDDEMKKPLVGIICAQSEIIPGHTHLSEVARAAAEGVIAAGGKPVIVPSIGVCDGIAMGHAGMRYSLPSREIIADSAEILIRAHAFQAAIFYGRKAGNGGPAGIIGTATHRTRRRRFRMRWTISNGISQAIPMSIGSFPLFRPIY